MKIKFNYLSYLVVFVVFLSSLTVLYLVLRYAPVFLGRENNEVVVIIGFTTAFFGGIYGIVGTTDLLINYRNKTRPAPDGILVSDMLVFKHKKIEYFEIKSAREDEYVHNVFLKAIVITLKTGKENKMLNFFVWPYSSAQAALNKYKIKIRNS